MPIHDLTCETEAEARAALAPVSPFTSINAHFGMLLGVEDLRLLQAYPRGKSRLHNAWLHGAGVVWGFDVLFNSESHELEVTPGLALDAAGHELYLERSACVDLVQWYERHRDDPDFSRSFNTVDGTVVFSATVIARFRPCLSRPVPAMAADCGTDAAQTAYSRVEETVELLLRPLPETPEAEVADYPRLRALFGLEVHLNLEAEQDVTDARARLPADTAPGERAKAFLTELRRLAALDVTARQPQNIEGRRSLFPRDPDEVLLAQILDITLVPSSSGGVVTYSLQLAAPIPDVTVRSSLVATSTIQELLAALLAQTPPATP